MPPAQDVMTMSLWRYGNIDIPAHVPIAFRILAHSFLRQSGDGDL